jgi:hypothetical protein
VSDELHIITWWDPDRLVNKDHNKPAIEIRILYNPDIQQHWVIETQLNRAVLRIQDQLRRIHFGHRGADRERRCTAQRPDDRTRCIYYDDHLGNHRWEPSTEQENT